MINPLAQIDYCASIGETPWHRASGLAKLLLALGAVAIAVFAPSLRMLGALHALVWVMVLTSRLPGRLVLAAAGYPILFAALFVVGRWDGTVATPLTVLLRPLTASLTAAWLVGTTPYPDVFAPLSRVLPRNAGDGLFLTYRALFALLERAEHLVQALRLRGGMSGPLRRRLRYTGEGLGTLVVYGFERSQRLYATMRLRGHSGRICGCRHYAEWNAADLWVVLAAAVMGTSALLWWRVG